MKKTIEIRKKYSPNECHRKDCRQHWYEEALKIVELTKDIRQNKGLTQNDVCKKSLMLQPNMSKLEAQGIIPRFDTMLSIFDAIGIKLVLEYNEPVEIECCKYGWSDCIFYNTDACLDCKDGDFYDDENK